MPGQVTTPRCLPLTDFKRSIFSFSAMFPANSVLICTTVHVFVLHGGRHLLQSMKKCHDEKQIIAGFVRYSATIYMSIAT